MVGDGEAPAAKTETRVIEALFNQEETPSGPLSLSPSLLRETLCDLGGRPVK